VLPGYGATEHFGGRVVDTGKGGIEEIVTFQR
jgi:hypothetical protein